MDERIVCEAPIERDTTSAGNGTSTPIEDLLK
jgi:hypothetical protein